MTTSAAVQQRPGIRREAVGDRNRVRRLLAEIHFFADAPREFVHHDAESTQVRIRPPRRDDVEEPADGVNVAGDETFDAGSQNLHDNIASLVACAVHLTE